MRRRGGPPARELLAPRSGPRSPSSARCRSRPGRSSRSCAPWPRKASIVLMDEPTSSLPREDVTRLFALIRRLKASGVTIVYISHFLEEVREIADRYTVLRDGRSVATRRPRRRHQRGADRAHGRTPRRRAVPRACPGAARGGARRGRRRRGAAGGAAGGVPAATRRDPRRRRPGRLRPHRDDPRASWASSRPRAAMSGSTAGACRGRRRRRRRIAAGLGYLSRGSQGRGPGPEPVARRQHHLHALSVVLDPRLAVARRPARSGPRLDRRPWR